MSNLATTVCGLRLRHPIMNGSGLLGSTREEMRILSSWNLAAVVTKTITQHPRAMRKPPNIIYLSDVNALVNSLGLPNPGASGVFELVEEAKSCGIPVIVSVGGNSLEEYLKVSSIAEEAGADAVELNLSCPTAKGYGLDLASEHHALGSIVSNVVGLLKIPVIVKLGVSFRQSLISLAGKALEEGARAITLINSIKVVSIDPEKISYSLSSSDMGYSGAPIYYIGLRAVYEVYREFGAEIIGCGGIRRWTDVASYILAGARSVQIVTSLMRARKPREYVEELLDKLKDWLEAKRFSSIEAAVGYIHKI